MSIRLDGLAGDRRFMLVDPDGQFITQRELQLLAQVEATHVTGGVHLRMGTAARLTVSFDPARRIDVRVWDSDVNAAVAEDRVNATLSGWFGRPVKLVHMDDQAKRAVGEEWAGRGGARRFRRWLSGADHHHRRRSPIST